MKSKKLVLTSALVGLAGLAALGYHLQKQVETQKVKRQLQEIRTYFETMGTIQVLFIKSYASQGNLLKGGLVFEDGRVLDFIYDAGAISYQEEDRD